MWLLNAMNRQMNNPAASKGSVTSAATGKVEVDTSVCNRDVPVIVPYGVYYVPPLMSDGVLITTDSGQLMAGVVMEDCPELEEGEIMLCSAGGASIVLKNSGAVIINGTEFGGA